MKIESLQETVKLKLLRIKAVYPYLVQLAVPLCQLSEFSLSATLLFTLYSAWTMKSVNVQEHSNIAT